MKKIVLALLLTIIFYSFMYSQEYRIEKVAEFENKNEKGYLLLRTELAAYDDDTGNYLHFDKDGNLFVFQFDSQLLLEINRSSFIISKVNDYKLPFLSSLMTIYNDCIGFQNTYDGYFLIDKKTKTKKFDVKEVGFEIRSVYYSEKFNVLLFADNEWNIHSIINPEIDDGQNKKNYRNPEQTKELFIKESEYGKKGIVIDGKKLFIDGKRYYWNNPNINENQYGISDAGCNFYRNTTKVASIWFKEIKNWNDIEEQYESMAVHPSGDIYVLRMNWSTNTHNLYRIDNTWDPEWREQWYKEHPEAE